MGRAFCIPGVFFLLIALVLSFLVSVSLPFLPALDVARVHFGTAIQAENVTGITTSRLGIWAHCDYRDDGSKLCTKTGHAYSVQYTAGSTSETVGASWTRGLAVHPVATAVIFVAFLLSFSTHVTVTLVSSLVSFLAALLTLIAFAIDIALFVFLKHQTKKLDVGANTNTAPGFWMTFAVLILLLLAGCTVCFGRRRDRMSGASSYPTTTNEKRGFFSRFRRSS